MRLLQFGAGNIGRSFIGQLFARAGWSVTFVDIDKRIVAAIRQRRGYPVIIKHPDGNEQRIDIQGVDAINAGDRAAVVEAVRDADLIATAVGAAALPHVAEDIAGGLQQRASAVNIVIAENIRDGAGLLRTELQRHLPPNSAVLSRTGLVETSIGKMVPLMTEADRRLDPLQLFAEPYNTLIVDRLGFRGPMPSVPGIKAVDNITAYVDRKLFIHNMGHAACAYLGYRHDPEMVYLWQAVELPAVRRTVTEAMQQSAAALLRAYPNDLEAGDLQQHIDDLLVRFGNRALGDTIYRVGRDIPRKLHKNERLVGAMLLADRLECSYDRIVEAARAALGFRARDERGRLFSADQRFHQHDATRGTDHILEAVCGLDRAVPEEKRLFEKLRQTLSS